MKDPFASDPLAVRAFACVRDNLLALVVGVGYLVYYGACALLVIAAIIAIAFVLTGGGTP